MAADVLAYNALAEINQELREQVVGLTTAIIDAGGTMGQPLQCAPGVDLSERKRCILNNAGSPNAGMWCMVPDLPASGASWTTGFKVCDTTNYRRCGATCTWTVPSGTDCVRFQVWGAGAGSGSGCCCGGSPNGGQGAYSSVIMPVQSGWTYTLCAGCAYCCYVERAQFDVDGNSSYVQGCNLCNFCAEGGEGNIFCEAKTRQYYASNIFSWCIYMATCICNNGTDYCFEQTTPGLGYPQGRRDASGQATQSCKRGYGCVYECPNQVYNIPGQYSYFAMDYGMDQFCLYQPGAYGYRTQSCCCHCVNNENSGCCYQACYCHQMAPGQGGVGYSTCGGDTSGCGDVGRMGMVCVSYC